MKNAVKYLITAFILLCIAVYADDKEKSPSGDTTGKDQLTADDKTGDKTDQSDNDKLKGDAAVNDKQADLKLPDEFSKLLKLTGMTFVMPDGFAAAEVDVLKCEDVNYFYAIKHSKKKLEVRYVIIPYRQAVKTESKSIPGSDSTYRVSAYTIASNIAGNEANILKTVEFNPQDVMTEFRAEWGASTVIKPESGFGDGYKMVVITSLYRSGRGEAYIIFLFDNYKEVKKEYDEAFYSLVFTE